MLGTGISFYSGLLVVLLGLLAVAGAGPYCLVEWCPECATESQDLLGRSSVGTSGQQDNIFRPSSS